MSLKYFRRKQVGITLLESLLVLAIGSSIIMMGMRQYYSFKSQSDAQKVRAYVDELFQAMSMYYKKNCYGQSVPQLDRTVVIRPGALNPSATTPPGPVFPISIATLRSEHLLGTFLNNAIPANQFVATTGPGENGYITQFNRHIARRFVCKDATCTNATRKEVGNIVTWRMQVSVLIRNTANAVTYRDYLGAECLSRLASDGQTVEPCETSGNTGTYAVFTNLPSLGSSESNSTYWQTMRVNSQFTQMYTTEPTQVLMNQDTTAQQNYLCAQ